MNTCNKMQLNKNMLWIFATFDHSRSSFCHHESFRFFLENCFLPLFFTQCPSNRCKDSEKSDRPIICKPCFGLILGPFAFPLSHFEVNRNKIILGYPPLGKNLPVLDHFASSRFYPNNWVSSFDFWLCLLTSYRFPLMGNMSSS